MFTILSLSLPVSISFCFSVSCHFLPSLSISEWDVCVMVSLTSCFPVSVSLISRLYLTLPLLPLPRSLPPHSLSVCPSLQIQAVGGQLLRDVWWPGHLRCQGRPQQGRQRLHHRGERWRMGPPGLAWRKDPSVASSMASCVLTQDTHSPEASPPPPSRTSPSPPSAVSKAFVPRGPALGLESSWHAV